ncbi:MAG TPA: thioredoxin domain-containing protein [Vicinamibacteria bacterium]|nr:thioredoxin domain-containing protein [Vicinamibacteria bacterium]
MIRPALARAVLVLVLSGAACSRSAAPRASASPAGGPAPPAVVAEVDGVPISGEELEGRVDRRLARLRQEEYEIRRQALDELIGERLLEKEASARGISKEEMLRDEVDRQVKEPDHSLVEQLYQQNKSRFAGQPKDEVAREIRKALTERARAERRAALQQKLRQKAEVRVRLEPPRIDVPVPASAPALGPRGAPVTIVQFTDYQCPFCHRAQATIDEVMGAYDGRVQLVHRDFPLDNHAQAFPAARAARCAGEQGRFWDFHRNLMTVRGTMDEADLRSRAASLKLDPGAFATCLSSGRHDAAIRESLEAGTRAGVQGTPAYFVNGRMLSGARPFEAFREVIDGELAR